MKITCIAGSGMGGTEKAAYLYACGLAQKGHTVEALTDPDGCRSDMLIRSGVTIRKVDHTIDGLADYFSEFRPDVVHNHTSGYSDQSTLYAALAKMSEHKPKLVETNVFGKLLDFHDHGDVDARLFITFTSGMQAYQRTRVIPIGPSRDRDNVVFYPLPDDAFAMDREDGKSLRKSLCVADNDVLVIRLGRPGSKWEAWECIAFQKARKCNSRLKLLLMEPKSSLTEDIKAGKYGEGIIIKQADSDPEVLRQVYSAGDIMFQASSFGESFGYTLAEGMAAGMPVITLSTPWGDQAQNELIEHGKTGYVCRSLKAMSEALLELSLDPEKSTRFGAAGKDRIRKITSLVTETSILEEIYGHLVMKNETPLADRRFKEWLAFISERSTKDIACYDKDCGMKTALYTASAYDAFRWGKHLIKYIMMRAGGKRVYPLKW